MTFWPHRQQKHHFLIRYELPICITAFDYQKSLESIYLPNLCFSAFFLYNTHVDGRRRKNYLHMTAFEQTWIAPPENLELPENEVHVWLASLEQPESIMLQLRQTLCVTHGTVSYDA